MGLTNNSGLGTELKLNVHMEPLDGHHLKDLDFHVTVYGSPGMSVHVEKKDTIEIDDDNFVVMLDSQALGSGHYYMRFTTYIPDSDFPDGLRTEVVTVDTGVVIIR